MRDRALDRLLQAAAQAPETTPEMPFGFATRVVALARAAGIPGRSESRQLARFLQRVALGAVVVAAFASSAAYWQMTENDDLSEPLSNVYAIADTAIEANVFP